jgi:hypothetical protein
MIHLSQHMADSPGLNPDTADPNRTPDVSPRQMNIFPYVL